VVVPYGDEVTNREVLTPKLLEDGQPLGPGHASPRPRRARRRCLFALAELSLLLDERRFGGGGAAADEAFAAPGADSRATGASPARLAACFHPSTEIASSSRVSRAQAERHETGRRSRLPGAESAPPPVYGTAPENVLAKRHDPPLTAVRYSPAYNRTPGTPPRDRGTL